MAPEIYLDVRRRYEFLGDLVPLYIIALAALWFGRRGINFHDAFTLDVI